MTGQPAARGRATPRSSRADTPRPLAPCRLPWTALDTAFSGHKLDAARGLGDVSISSSSAQCSIADASLHGPIRAHASSGGGRVTVLPAGGRAAPAAWVSGRGRGLLAHPYVPPKRFAPRLEQQRSRERSLDGAAGSRPVASDRAAPVASPRPTGQDVQPGPALEAAADVLGAPDRATLFARIPSRRLYRFDWTDPSCADAPGGTAHLDQQPPQSTTLDFIPRHLPRPVPVSIPASVPDFDAGPEQRRAAPVPQMRTGVCGAADFDLDARAGRDAEATTSEASLTFSGAAVSQGIRRPPPQRYQEARAAVAAAVAAAPPPPAAPSFTEGYTSTTPVKAPRRPTVCLVKLLEMEALKAKAEETAAVARRKEAVKTLLHNIQQQRMRKRARCRRTDASLPSELSSASGQRAAVTRDSPASISAWKDDVPDDACESVTGLGLSALNAQSASPAGTLLPREDVRGAGARRRAASASVSPLGAARPTSGTGPAGLAGAGAGVRKRSQSAPRSRRDSSVYGSGASGSSTRSMRGARHAWASSRSAAPAVEVPTNDASLGRQDGGADVQHARPALRQLVFGTSMDSLADVEGEGEGGGGEGGGGRGGRFSLDAASTGPVDWESLLQDADRLLSMRVEADERASQQMLQRAPHQHQPPPQTQVQPQPRNREAGASASTRGSARHGAGSRASATRSRPRSATSSPPEARMMRRQRSRASRRAVSAGGQASQLSSQSLGSTISGPAAVASDGSVSSCSPRAPVREVARGLASLGVMGNRTAEDKRRVLKQQQARRARQEREKRLEAEAVKARLAEAKEKYKRLSVEQARAFQQQRNSRSEAIRAQHTAAGASKSQARAGEEGQSRRARSPAAPVTHAGTQRGSNEGMFGEWASQDSLEDGDLAAATQKQPTRQEERASKSAGAAPAASRNKTTRGAAGVAVKMVAAVQQQAAKRVQQQQKAQRVTRSFADRRPQERARVSAAKNGDGHESRQRQSDARAFNTAKAQGLVSKARGEGSDQIDYRSFLQNQKAAENLLDSLISWTRSSSIMQSPTGLMFGTTSAEGSQLLTGTGEVKPEGDSEGSLESPELVLTSERMLDMRPRLPEGIAGDCAEHADGVESEPDEPLALTNGNQTRPGAHDSGDLLVSSPSRSSALSQFGTGKLVLGPGMSRPHSSPPASPQRQTTSPQHSPLLLSTATKLLQHPSSPVHTHTASEQTGLSNSLSDMRAYLESSTGLALAASSARPTKSHLLTGALQRAHNVADRIEMSLASGQVHDDVMLHEQLSDGSVASSDGVLDSPLPSPTPVNKIVVESSPQIPEAEGQSRRLSDSPSSTMWSPNLSSEGGGGTIRSLAALEKDSVATDALAIVKQTITEEEGRCKQQFTLLRMREEALQERAEMELETIQNEMARTRRRARSNGQQPGPMLQQLEQQQRSVLARLAEEKAAVAAQREEIRSQRRAQQASMKAQGDALLEMRQQTIELLQGDVQSREAPGSAGNGSDTVVNASLAESEDERFGQGPGSMAPGTPSSLVSSPVSEPRTVLPRPVTDNGPSSPGPGATRVASRSSPIKSLSSRKHPQSPSSPKGAEPVTAKKMAASASDKPRASPASKSPQTAAAWSNSPKKGHSPLKSFSLFARTSEEASDASRRVVVGKRRDEDYSQDAATPSGSFGGSDPADSALCADATADEEDSSTTFPDKSTHAGKVLEPDRDRQRSLPLAVSRDNDDASVNIVEREQEMESEGDGDEASDELQGMAEHVYDDAAGEEEREGKHEQADQDVRNIGLKVECRNADVDADNDQGVEDTENVREGERIMEAQGEHDVDDEVQERVADESSSDIDESDACKNERASDTMQQESDAQRIASPVRHGLDSRTMTAASLSSSSASSSSSPSSASPSPELQHKQLGGSRAPGGRGETLVLPTSSLSTSMGAVEALQRGAKLSPQAATPSSKVSGWSPPVSPKRSPKLSPWSDEVHAGCHSPLLAAKAVASNFESISPPAADAAASAPRESLSRSPPPAHKVAEVMPAGGKPVATSKSDTAVIISRAHAVVSPSSSASRRPSLARAEPSPPGQGADSPSPSRSPSPAARPSRSPSPAPAADAAAAATTPPGMCDAATAVMFAHDVLQGVDDALLAALAPLSVEAHFLNLVKARGDLPEWQHIFHKMLFDLLNEELQNMRAEQARLLRGASLRLGSGSAFGVPQAWRPLVPDVVREELLLRVANVCAVGEPAAAQPTPEETDDTQAAFLENAVELSVQQMERAWLWCGEEEDAVVLAVVEALFEDLVADSAMALTSRQDPYSADVGAPQLAAAPMEGTAGNTLLHQFETA